MCLAWLGLTVGVGWDFWNTELGVENLFRLEEIHFLFWKMLKFERELRNVLLKKDYWDIFWTNILEVVSVEKSWPRCSLFHSSMVCQNVSFLAAMVYSASILRLTPFTTQLQGFF